MTATARTSSTDRHRHKHRKRTARLYLVGIFLLLAAADAALFRFTFSQHNPWRILIGVMFGQSIATLFLLALTWMRQPWARYVLIVVLFGVIVIYSTVGLYLAAHPEFVGPRTMELLCGAIGLVIIANSWLIRSKRIQYLASLPGSGG